jgi:hypothetical protein
MRIPRLSVSAAKLVAHDSPVCPRSLCGAGALFGI